MANIAFEVTKGLVTKSRLEKFDKHFTKNVIKPLEKNCVNACDPQCESHNSIYSKMMYYIPGDLSVKVPKGRNPPGKKIILEKCTLGNIHF